jgi:hypothetical protein
MKHYKAINPEKVDHCTGCCFIKNDDHICTRTDYVAQPCCHNGRHNKIYKEIIVKLNINTRVL